MAFRQSVASVALSATAVKPRVLGSPLEVIEESPSVTEATRTAAILEAKACRVRVIGLGATAVGASWHRVWVAGASEDLGRIGTAMAEQGEHCTSQSVIARAGWVLRKMLAALSYSMLPVQCQYPASVDF
jgi:hypothetical protein